MSMLFLALSALGPQAMEDYILARLLLRQQKEEGALTFRLALEDIGNEDAFHQFRKVSVASLVYRYNSSHSLI
jgi:hypothetical protein